MSCDSFSEPIIQIPSPKRNTFLKSESTTEIYSEEKELLLRISSSQSLSIGFTDKQLDIQEKIIEQEELEFPNSIVFDDFNMENIARETGYSILFVGDKILDYINGEIDIQKLKVLIESIIKTEKQNNVHTNYNGESGLLSVALRIRYLHVSPKDMLRVVPDIVHLLKEWKLNVPEILDWLYDILCIKKYKCILGLTMKKLILKNLITMEEYKKWENENFE
jgi:hypothetical protein